jgi:LysR family transcriptional regulator, nod-box dependent transcriptional activator
LDGDALATLGYVRKVGTAVEQFTLIPEFIVGTMQIATVHVGLARLFAKALSLGYFPRPSRNSRVAHHRSVEFCTGA